MNRNYVVAAAVVAVVVGAGVYGLVFTSPIGPDDTAGTPEPTATPAGTATPGAQTDADAQFTTSDQHEAVLLPASTEALVEGETSLDSGASVTIHLQSANGSSFETTKQALVLRDGTFGAVVDLHEVAPTTRLDASVSYNGTDVATESVRVTGPNGTHFHVDGERVTVRNASGQQIRGATDLDPGTNITVRARGTGSNPFLRSTVTTVDENGTFVATLDFSGVDSGTEFTVTARHAGDTIERRGVVDA